MALCDTCGKQSLDMTQILTSNLAGVWMCKECLAQVATKVEMEEKRETDFVLLARRAVACKGWRWMAGMACFNPRMPNLWYRRVGDEGSPQFRFLLPDLDDAATKGCLTALARELTGDPYQLFPFDSRKGEAEVLVDVLEGLG